MFKRGYKSAIKIEDMWQAREADYSWTLGDRLEEAWEHELDNARRNGGKASLSKAIIRSFWLEYMICGLGVGILFIVLWYVIHSSCMNQLSYMHFGLKNI